MFYVILLLIMSIKCLNMYKGVSKILINDFKRALNSGFGSAIMELKKSKDKESTFKDAILYATLHNTCYDPNCEDERYSYLFDAIKCTDDIEFYEDKIIEKLFKSDFFFTVQQLSGLLYLFGKEGSKKAVDALINRFDEYLILLPKKRIYTNAESSIKCAEIIAIRLCEFYGVDYFLKYIENIEEILDYFPEKSLFPYDLILNYSYEKFNEKKVLSILKKKSKKSDKIKSFLDKLLLDELIRKGSSENVDLSEITYKTLINSVEKEDVRYLSLLSTKASRTAKEIEVLQAADRFKSEKNLKIMHALIIFFIFIDYPYNISDIISKYDVSKDESFKADCLNALSRYKDKRLHELAVYNLKNKILIKESLGLLIKNFSDDYSYILEALEEHKDNQRYDFHALALQVIKIFQNRRCKKAFEVLAYTYKKSRCSCCRTSLIKIMCNNNIISDEILQECLYDCSYETKTLAQNYIRSINN